MNEVRDPRFEAIANPTAEPERVGTGYLFTEGPLWHSRDAFLLFSDMPGDVIRRWSATEGVTEFRRPSNMANGLAYDREGRLLACEHATSRVTRTEPDGRVTILATHYREKELNSPNDIVAKSDGAVYFSDPTFGRVEFYGRPRSQDLDFQGVYRLDPESRALELLVDDFAQPNGLCFSADETRLFINDTPRAHIRVFAVGASGHLTGGEIWAETVGAGEGAPDGMKIDAAGNLFCCGPGGIHVFAPDASCLGVIRTPEVAANFTWGGADLRTLFITASTSLYRLPVMVPGRPAF
jgi:gluconolactonase